MTASVFSTLRLGIFSSHSYYNHAVRRLLGYTNDSVRRYSSTAPITDVYMW